MTTVERLKYYAAQMRPSGLGGSGHALSPSQASLLEDAACEIEYMLAALRECASRCRYDGDHHCDLGLESRRDASWEAMRMAERAIAKAEGLPDPYPEIENRLLSSTQLEAKITIGDKYGPAMKIDEQADADAYFERCVEHNMRVSGVGRVLAESVERQNLGYYAGYYDNETRQRVERLFKCSHPIFGSIAQVGAPSPEEAFQAGKDLAARR